MNELSNSGAELGARSDHQPIFSDTPPAAANSNGDGRVDAADVVGVVGMQ